MPLFLRLSGFSRFYRNLILYSVCQSLAGIEEYITSISTFFNQPKYLNIYSSNLMNTGFKCIPKAEREVDLATMDLNCIISIQ